jgi:hypothetical protein
MKNIKDDILSAFLFLILAAAVSCKSNETSPDQPKVPVQRILFVGDSFTHGRYTPVRPYNSNGANNITTGSNLVYDENYGQTGARKELESGPYGGIPGIFAEMAYETGLNYDVHIEAISETSLEKNFAAASGVIAQSKWNAVVLQELSSRPLPYSLTNDATSDPSNFCSTIAVIEKAVHQASSSAKVYLYEPWPRADLATTLSGGDTSSANFNSNYLKNLSILADANHNVYYSAALHDGNIAAVAPTGDAWVNAWAASDASPNPYAAILNEPVLWYGFNTVNSPVIKASDYIHPSVYGAYLSALVLFQQITHVDTRTLGAQEKAAVFFNIPADIAVKLQAIAWQTVTQESAQPINQSVDPCTIGAHQ